MNTFGLKLKQEYEDLFLEAITASFPDEFSAALADCDENAMHTLETIINDYYEITSLMRDHGESDASIEAAAVLFSAAAAPVISLIVPVLVMEPISAPKSIILAQLSYGGKKFGTDINTARGFMVERLVTQGNTWGTPQSVYQWLGENYREIGKIASELERRNSVEHNLISELLRSAPTLVSGSL